MCKRAGIVICDGSRLFREGLASLLQQSQFKVHTLAGDFDELQRKLPRPIKGLLFLIGAHSAADLDLQEIGSLKRLHPGCHVIVLINSCSEEQRWQAAHFGLDGVLLKSISTEVLCLSLDLVRKSQSVFIVDSDLGNDDYPAQNVFRESPVAALKANAPNMIDSPHEPSETGAPTIDVPVPPRGPMTVVSSRREGLSDRELEILDCLVNGHSNKVIARRCNITEATVKVHLKAILRKISVANRTQAAVWAINKMHRDSAETLAPVPAMRQAVSEAAVGKVHVDDAEEPDRCAGRAVDPPHVLALINGHMTVPLNQSGH